MKRVVEARKRLVDVMQEVEDEYDMRLVYGTLYINEIHVYGVDSLKILAERFGEIVVLSERWSDAKQEYYEFFHEGTRYFAIETKEAL